MNILRKWRLRKSTEPDWPDRGYWEYRGVLGPYATVREFDDFSFWVTYTDYGGEINRGVSGNVAIAKAMAEKELKSESLW